MVRGPVVPEPATRESWWCLHCRGSLIPGELMLHCSACGRRYPVVAGIPLLVREPASYFHAERAALLHTSREARRRREQLGVDGIYTGLTAASLERHRDVSETEEAQAE